MDFEKIEKKDKKYIAPTYNRFALAIESGEGATVTDASGRKYVDFTSGIGVNIFGINDEAWKEAVTEQLGKVQHACNLYYTQPQTELAEHLCKKSGAKKVFFGNSGAEANECAIKAARKYSALKYGDNKRYEIVTLTDSFHGRTLATLAATGQDAFHKYFGPFPAGFSYAKPDFESLKSKVTEKTCAIMLELIQGESGVHVLDKSFVRQTIEFCQSNDILVIIDEVQTGNGRTGYMYSYQSYGIMPDIVTTAKGLGGGLPIGACGGFFLWRSRDDVRGKSCDMRGGAQRRQAADGGALSRSAGEGRIFKDVYFKDERRGSRHGDGADARRGGAFGKVGEKAGGGVSRKGADDFDGARQA